MFINFLKFDDKIFIFRTKFHQKMWEKWGKIYQKITIHKFINTNCFLPDLFNLFITNTSFSSCNNGYRHYFKYIYIWKKRYMTHKINVMLLLKIYCSKRDCLQGITSFCTVCVSIQSIINNIHKYAFIYFCLFKHSCINPIHTYIQKLLFWSTYCLWKSMRG